MKLLALCLAVTSVLMLQGCAALAELGRDPRDAAWDPKPGQSLFAQLPPWERAAFKRCRGRYEERAQGDGCR